MRRLAFFVPFLVAVGVTLSLGGQTHAYSQTKLMDDAVFDSVNSLNSAQVADFLAARSGPFTKLSTPSPCLSGYNDINFYWDGSKWHYGSDADWNTAWGPAQIPASTIIYKAAQMWGLNPEVIISTLQKEESLITGTSCDGWRYNSAMGYGCPDSGGCNAKYAGYTKQVLWGAWQLKFNKERSYGNTSWDGDDVITYVGYMTQGVRKRCGTCTSVYYDGYATLDGQSVYLENGTTASLYTYTPHLGNSTPVNFERWFGLAVLPTYSWAFVSQGAYTDSSKTTPLDISNLHPGQTGWLIIRAQNTGSATWTNTGPNPVRIATDRPADRSSIFAASSWIAPWRPSAMTETSVAPGQIATFEFAFKAPAVDGTFREYFNPLAEGLTRFGNGVGQFFPMTVKGQFAWSFASQASYSDNTKATPLSLNGLSPGQTGWLVLKAKNIGNATWYNSGDYPVRLGTDRAMQRTSRFATNAWLNTARPANLSESSVEPGQVGTFEFPIQTPIGGGSWREYFNPLAEGYMWMNNDVGQFFPIIVNSSYSWAFSSQASYTDNSKSIPLDLSNLNAGQNGWLVVKARNTGNTIWYNNGPSPLHLGTDQPKDRTSAFATNAWLSPQRPGALAETSVTPGQVGTFEFPFQAPMISGFYKEYFNPLVEGYSWLNNDVGQYFPFSVH